MSNRGGNDFCLSFGLPPRLSLQFKTSINPLTTPERDKVMKILSLALMLMASMAFVMLGCSDNSNSVVTPTDLAISSVSLPASLAKGGVLHSVTGSAHVTIFDGETYYDGITVSAIDHGSGEFSGSVRYFDRLSAMQVMGKVIDVKVEGNKGKVSWEISRLVNPLWEPMGYGFVVLVDNGQGNAPGPDQMSWVILPDPSGTPDGKSIQDLINMTPDGFLAWLESRGNTPTLFSYVNGNLQVR
jgi:hypothetical protein